MDSRSRAIWTSKIGGHVMRITSRRIVIAALLASVAVPSFADKPAQKPTNEVPPHEAQKRKSTDKLKQISLAFHDYVSAFGKLPTAAITDKNGKPLLSWRVTILPFVEHEKLYQQFKLDEPWDSAHNIKLVQQMPSLYQHPLDEK